MKKRNASIPESKNPRIEQSKQREIRASCRLRGLRFLSALLAGFVVLWLSFAGGIPSVVFAQTSPCSKLLDDDYVVGMDESEEVTITENTIYKGRIVVRNESTLQIRGADIELNGDIVVCDNSKLQVERAIVTANMDYWQQRQFLAFNSSSLEFTDSFVIHPRGLLVSIILSESSHLTLDKVNRTDLRRSDLEPKIGGFTTALRGGSSATITDTLYRGEVSGLLGAANLQFIRSRELTLWLNFLQPNAGGTFSLPTTEDQPISWQFDRNTPGVQGIEYSITIENSRFIATGALIWITAGMPNVDITMRDSSAYIGLIFINQDDVHLTNLRERRYADFTPATANRHIRLQNLKVLTWSIYASSSIMAITDSEIGEATVDTAGGRTSRIHLAHSKLTGNGGHYRAVNTNGVAPAPSLIVTDCDVYSSLNAGNGAVVIMESSRVYESGEGTASGADLVADNGTLLLLNSVLPPDIDSTVRGTGLIWQASMTPTITIKDDGTRVATFQGNAALTSSTRTFVGYSLEWAPEANPSQRDLVHISQDPVTDGTLATLYIPDSTGGGNYIATLTVADSTGASYQVTRPVHLPDQGGVIPYSLQGNAVEGLAVSTTNGDSQSGSIKGGPQSGSIALYPDVKGQSVPAGTAFYGYTQDGIPVTEAAVPESSLTTKALAFVVSDDTVDTLIAIANPGPDGTSVQITLIDESGQELDKTSLKLNQYEQTSNFVKDLIPTTPATFKGSLRIESEAPVAIVALKQTTNESGNPILATLPVADLTAKSSADSLLLPYITEGDGTQTQIILVNTTDDTITGQVNFYAPDGSGLPLTIGGKTSEVLSYEIPSGGIETFTTAGKADTAQLGLAQITPDKGQAPTAAALFSSVQKGVPVWEAGYSAPSATTRALLYAELSDQIKLGLTIVNPDTTAATVTLSLKSNDGRLEVKRARVTIPASGQVSQPLTQLMDIVLGTLRGALEITSDKPVYIVGLRSTTTKGKVAIMTALPAFDLVSLPRRDRAVFPYYVFGNTGFTTQFMMMNIGSSAVSGSIYMLTSDGALQPMNIRSLF